MAQIKPKLPKAHKNNSDRFIHFTPQGLEHPVYVLLRQPCGFVECHTCGTRYYVGKEGVSVEKNGAVEWLPDGDEAAVVIRTWFEAEAIAKHQPKRNDRDKYLAAIKQIASKS